MEPSASEEREKIAAWLDERSLLHKRASKERSVPGCHWERGDELDLVAREIRDGVHREEN